eukprot:jgi/Undpi1/12874/HiC_scaffold_7.g02541.m1
MQTYHPNGRTATSYWNAEPRVILSNDSDYIVSFWVVEEDKKRTKDQQQKIVRSIGLQLNASFNRSSNIKHNNTSNDKTTSNKSNDNSANNVGSLNKHSSSAGPPPSDDRETTQAFGETLDQTGGEEEDEVYYLMRDHRMGRKSSTQPTQVPFPADCKHMRVYAFFEDRGEWQCFKDQVYSIALINKNFRIAASTSNITPYHSKTSGTPKLLLGKA